jgi:hypothetical protein
MDISIRKLSVKPVLNISTIKQNSTKCVKVTFEDGTSYKHKLRIDLKVFFMGLKAYNKVRVIVPKTNSIKYNYDAKYTESQLRIDSNPMWQLLGLRDKDIYKVFSDNSVYNNSMIYQLQIL